MSLLHDMIGNMKDPACPFCDPLAQAKDLLLQETENFRIILDAHPLIEGHILIVPKDHISCVGEYPESLVKEFDLLYQKVCAFIKSQYGKVSTFEHGKIGQSIVHSHVHMLPFIGEPTQIVIEGGDHLKKIGDIKDVKKFFELEDKYLFFSIEDGGWVVDTELGFPRFFRDRFAEALGRPERANWKEMHTNKDLMVAANKENGRVQELWRSYFL